MRPQRILDAKQSREYNVTLTTLHARDTKLRCSCFCMIDEFACSKLRAATMLQLLCSVEASVTHVQSMRACSNSCDSDGFTDLPELGWTVTSTGSAAALLLLPAAVIVHPAQPMLLCQFEIVDRNGTIPHSAGATLLNYVRRCLQPHWTPCKCCRSSPVTAGTTAASKTWAGCRRRQRHSTQACQVPA